MLLNQLDFNWKFVCVNVNWWIVHAKRMSIDENRLEKNWFFSCVCLISNKQNIEIKIAESREHKSIEPK